MDAARTDCLESQGITVMRF
ncbi:hypothetical protein [Marilutibacter alkalisoli]